jgi:hypothetical protein
MSRVVFLDQLNMMSFKISIKHRLLIWEEKRHAKFPYKSEQMHSFITPMHQNGLARTNHKNRSLNEV